MTWIIVAGVALIFAQADEPPTASAVAEARYARFQDLHGTMEAAGVCHAVGEVLSTRRVGARRYSVEYDEVMHYNDPKLPRPNVKRVVIVKSAGRWIWISGDEPTCQNFVL